MTKPARIAPKVFDPLSFDHDGWFRASFQGDDPSINFQMVPAFGGGRLITALVDGEACVVSSRNTSIATVSAPLQDASSSVNRVVLLPIAGAGEFPFVVEIHGHRAGRTLVDLSDMNGQSLGTVDVSVKEEVQKTYRLWGLKDIVRRTTRTPDQMINIMNNVTRLYKSQANVKLTQLGAPLDLLFKTDLGDPISSPNLLLARIGAGIKLSGLSTADFDMVSTWDIPDAVGQTSDIAGDCMIEDYKPGHELSETSSYAHELGHAFSCGHTDRTKMMMSGDGSDGFQMTRTDINTINTTGLDP
ncbi:MAG TPA: hypothetical protein VKS78_15930 [Roseiarcus sp.]|nr:hypothetical protein [Roseiarcus sp.]